MKYDILYTNGNIFTSDVLYPYGEAMAVKDGRIAWIGSNAEAACLTADAGAAVNLGGRRILPGFVDSHMHAIMLADCCKQISALPPTVYSIEELTQKIADARTRQAAGQWIEGWGYDEGKLAERRSPTCVDLDRGCSDAPVKILRTCGHICVVNSLALKLAGITGETPDPEGGRIGRFEDGTPNGVLYENARNLLDSVLPVKSVRQHAANLKDLGDLLLSQGITTCADMGELEACDYNEIYSLAIEKGFRNKVGCYYMWDEVKHKPDFTIGEEEQSPARQVRIAGIKLIGDGSVSGRTAWCDAPYLQEEGSSGDESPDIRHPEHEYGMPVCCDEDYESAKQFCKAHGCQLSIHAMGSRTIDRALEHTWKEKTWTQEGVPHVRMEHVAMPTRDAIKKAAKSGIGWVTQPIFLYAEIESYLKNLGLERTQASYPIGDFIHEGVRFCFSTDAPATAWAVPSNPFVNLKAAVTRRAWDGTDCGKQHRVDVETAIRLYTAASAPMVGFCDTGMLREGYAADFIMLDRDILKVPDEEIDQVKVLATWINGEKVYERIETD